jgi:sugar phosphate isomerase/epimerase
MAAIAGSAAAATATSGVAATRQPFFKRGGRPIGLQLYVLGDEPKRDLDGVFARVAKIGYRDIEMPELFGRAPADVRAAAERAGLTISSLHVPAVNTYNPSQAALTGETALIVDQLSTLGVRNAVLPLVPTPAGFVPKSMETFGQDLLSALAAAGPDHWKRTAALLNEKAAALKSHGIAVAYHNHAFEFAPLGNENGWAILLRETDPALVHFEVDVAWVTAAGLDPVAFLDEHRGRVRLLHIKDLKWSGKVTYGVDVPSTEVGSGTLDWARILPAAHRAGVQHYYVEQEPPYAIPRIEAAARSYAFLSRLLG